MQQFTAILAQTRFVISSDEENRIFELLSKQHQFNEKLVGYLPIDHRQLVLFASPYIEGRQFIIQLDGYGEVHFSSCDTLIANILEVRCPSGLYCKSENLRISEADHLIASSVQSNFNACYFCNRCSNGWVLVMDTMDWQIQSSSIKSTLQNIPMLNLLDDAVIRRPTLGECIFVPAKIAINAEFIEFWKSDHHTAIKVISKYIQFSCSEAWGSEIVISSVIPFHDTKALSKKAQFVELDAVAIIFSLSGPILDVKRMDSLVPLNFVFDMPLVTDKQSAEAPPGFRVESSIPCTCRLTINSSFFKEKQFSDRNPRMVPQINLSSLPTLKASDDRIGDLPSSPTLSAHSMDSDSMNMDGVRFRHVFCWWHYETSPLLLNQELVSFISNLKSIMAMHVYQDDLNPSLLDTIFASKKYSNTVFVSLQDLDKETEASSSLLSNGNIVNSNGGQRVPPMPATASGKGKKNLFVRTDGLSGNATNDSAGSCSDPKMLVSLNKSLLKSLSSYHFRTIAYFPHDSKDRYEAILAELKSLLYILRALNRHPKSHSPSIPSARGSSDVRPLLCLVCDSKVKGSIESYINSLKWSAHDVLEIVFCCPSNGGEDYDDLEFDLDLVPGTSRSLMYSSRNDGVGIVSPSSLTSRSVDSVLTSNSLAGLAIDCEPSPYASYRLEDVSKYHGLSLDQKLRIYNDCCSGQASSVALQAAAAEAVQKESAMVMNAQAALAAFGDDSDSLGSERGLSVDVSISSALKGTLQLGQPLVSVNTVDMNASLKDKFPDPKSLSSSFSNSGVDNEIGQSGPACAIVGPSSVPKPSGLSSLTVPPPIAPLPSRSGLGSNSWSGPIASSSPQSSSPPVPIFGSSPPPKYSIKPNLQVSGHVEASIDLLCLSVATHFKNLMIWADQNEFVEDMWPSSVGGGLQRSLKGRDQNDKRLQINMSPNGVIFVRTGSLLLGEAGVTKVEVEATECYLTLMIDVHTKTFTLTISGGFAELVDRRFRIMESLVSAANRQRGYFPLKSWRHCHVDCLVNSMVIQSEERNRETTVLFHKYDNAVVAEIASFDKEKYVGMCQFLEGLNPTEANWSLARHMFNNYLDMRGGWRILKVRFATFIDRESAQLLNSSTLTCRVFGFAGYIDAALQHVLSNPSPSQSSPSQSTPIQYSQQLAPSASYGSSNSSPQSASSSGKTFNFINTGNTSHSMQGNLGGAPSHGSFHGLPLHPSRSTTPSESFMSAQPQMPSSLPLPSLSPSSANAHHQFFGSGATPDAVLRPVSGSVVLADKDAICFYLAFENAFCTYLSRVFNVTTQDSSNIDNALNSPTPQQLLSQPITPHNKQIGSSKTSGPLRISFHGHNPKDVKSAALYLEKLNTGGLKSYQAFFPRVDASKYKELNSYKTQHEGVLRVIRSRALAEVAPEFSSAATTLSSLGSAGKSRTRSLSSNEDGNSSANEFSSRSPANSDDLGSRFSVADGVDIVDPLLTKGYINITIKPPLHSRGLKRMTFPADVVITVTAYLNEFESDFRSICTGFDSIECNHFAGQIDVPMNTHLAKIMMSRQARDEFTFENNLIALRFIEQQRSSTVAQKRGIVGSVKFWVSSFDHMIAFFDHLQYLGGINKVVTSNPQYPSAAKNPFQQSTLMLSSASDLNNTQSSARFSETSSTLSSGRSMGGSEPSSLTKQQQQHNQSTPSPGQSFQSTSASASSIPGMERSVIRWPHSSFRFMFLGELLKRNMNALLAKLRSTLGITTTCPYRDKTDAMACLLLESGDGLITEATQRVNEFMHAVLSAMICVCVAVNQNQRKVLMAQDLLKIKEVQGKCGVHIILDPQESDMSRCKSCVDMRLPITTPTVPAEEMTGIGVGLGIGLGVGVTLGVDFEDPPVPVDDGLGNVVIPTPVPGQSLAKSTDGVLASLTYIYPLDLISVSTLTATGCAVKISVVNEEIKKVYGNRVIEFYPEVSNYSIVSIIDPNDETNFSLIDVERLNRGEVLVDSIFFSRASEESERVSPFPSPRNKLVRVRPEFIAFGSRASQERVLDGLERAIISGLRTCESMGLETVLLMAPMGNSLFANIEGDALVTRITEAVVSFAQHSTSTCVKQLWIGDSCPMSFVLSGRSELISCSDHADPCISLAYDPNYLQPFGGNKFAASLLSFLESDVDPIASVSAFLSNKGAMQQSDNQPKMELISLNSPIPIDLNVDAIVQATAPVSSGLVAGSFTGPPVPPLPLNLQQISSPSKAMLQQQQQQDFLSMRQQLQLPLSSLQQPQMQLNPNSKTQYPGHVIMPNGMAMPMHQQQQPQMFSQQHATIGSSSSSNNNNNNITGSSNPLQSLLSPRTEPPSLLVVQGVPAGVMIALSYLRCIAQG